MSGPGRSLPLAPKAAPGRRHLPLAAEARARRSRHAPDLRGLGDDAPVRSRLPALRLARRPRARPTSSPPPRSLDLVRQMADLGVLEVSAHRRRGLPARRLARDRRRGPRRGDAAATMTTGGRGLTRRARAARRGRGPRRASASRSTARRRPTIACAASPARTASALAAAAPTCEAAGIPVSVNTQINRAVDDRSPRACSSTAIALGVARLAGAAHRRDGARGRRARRARSSPTSCST